jgi:hypothetical protein
MAPMYRQAERLANWITGIDRYAQRARCNQVDARRKRKMKMHILWLYLKTRSTGKEIQRMQIISTVGPQICGKM